MKKIISQILKEAPSTIDKLDAELIVSHVVNKPREFVIAHPDMKTGRLKDWKIRRLLKKRGSGIPLAYLTGHKEFFGLDFKINKYTLVPRSDTELLVELAINQIKKTLALPPLVGEGRDGVTSSKNKELILIDVGTGSGCIPISILKNINSVGIKTYATDISKQALKVAKQNAKTHSANINFLHGNLLEPTLRPFNPSTLQPIIITTNLPYLTEEQFKSESSIHHEPKSALVAKNKGLALYEELFNQIKNLFTVYCLLLTIYLEIDPSQSKLITKLIKKYLPNAKIEIKKDLASLDRVVILNF